MNGHTGADDGFVAIVAPTASDAADVRQMVGARAIKVHILQELLDRDIVQTDASGKPLAVEKRSAILGCVATSQSGAAALTAAKETLALFCGPASYDQLDLGGTDGVRFQSWLVDRTLDLARTLSGDAVQLRRAMAILRREHDETLGRFGELDHAAYLSMPRRVMKLSYGAGYSRAHLGAGGQSRLIQRLPTPAAGLALIELHLEPRSHGRRGMLEMSLFAGGAPRPVYRWDTPVGDFGGGWVPFWLDRALTVGAIDVRLELSWRGALGEELELTLGVPSPLDEFCAQSEAGVSLAAPLAVKVWGAPPGSLVSTREPQMGGEANGLPAGAPAAPVADPVRIGLGAHELSKIERISPTDPQSGFEVINLRVEQLDILVHPTKIGPTIGVVRDLGLPGVRALSSIVVVDNKAAKAVEFGLAIVPKQALYADPASFIKTWTRVEPLIYTEVVGTVDQEDSSSWDLIVGTRMADGADPHLAWAYFKRIEVVA